MSFDFKPQQRLALEYHGNVAVSAGAGSGKTRVLVEKYFRLLVDEHPDWPIEAVVAITFTIKAANELRQRIIKRVREELGKPEVPPERGKRLLELRREIAGAPIGTIHNFCSRTLREFAFEASLNPDFAIVEGARESSLRREAVQQAIAETANRNDTLEYSDLLTLLAVYPQRQLFGILESMLERRAEFGPACRRYALEDEQTIYSELQGLCTEVAGSGRDQLEQNLQQCLRALHDASAIAGDTVLVPFSARLNDLLNNNGPWTEVVELASQLELSLFTTTGSLRNKLEKSLGIGGSHAVVQRLLEACTACSDAPRMELGPEDLDSIRLASMLAKLYLQTEVLYERLRSATNTPDEVDLLDFTDLELHAERLISNNANARRNLRERIRYLIVDEFQDTSELQWRILGPLVSDDRGVMLPCKFFMVGDPKQGVYGFRQASSRLFAHVRALTTQSNPDDGCRGNISITYNFRSLAKPLHAVNELFGNLMRDSQSVHDVIFEALEAQRETPEGQTKLLISNSTLAQSDADNADQFSEPIMVAKEIQRLIAENPEKQNIAILFRKRKHFDAYESALRQRGMPYVTHRGKGLYEQPEVLDLIAALRLLANPHDDRLTLEVVRGSLFNFSDDLLLKISLGRGESFWSKCCAIATGVYPDRNRDLLGFTTEEITRLSQLAGIVGQLNSMVGVFNIADILGHILDLTGARAVIAAGVRGLQAQANIQKFLELSHSLQVTDLDEYLAYIDSESVDGRGQGEATLHSTAGTAVEIMTIHAAKGLEFDTVFLPELADPINVRPDNVITDGRRWLALQKSLSAERPRLFLSDYLLNEKKQRAISEEKRVLYVAMTRCRDNLYLSATEGGKKQQDSFYGWMLPHVDRLGLTRNDRSNAPGQNDDAGVGGPREPAYTSSTVALHDGLFERTQEAWLTQLKLNDCPPAPSANIRIVAAGIPFHPFSPASQIEPVELDELIAAREGAVIGTDFLLFRGAFSAGARQLHRGPTVALAAATEFLEKISSFRESTSDIVAMLDNTIQYVSGNSKLARMHLGPQVSALSGLLLVNSHCDLHRKTDMESTGVFVVPDNRLLPCVKMLMRTYAGLFVPNTTLKLVNVPTRTIDDVSCSAISSPELSKELLDMSIHLKRVLTESIDLYGVLA